MDDRKRGKKQDDSKALTRAPGRRLLTAAKFQGLANVPPEAEWFANIDNPKTRRAYRIDINEFMDFAGIAKPEEFRIVTRAHVIAWRKSLEGRALSAATIRRKLSALSSLFDYLCEKNAVAHNPVDGVKRPTAEANEGKTPAIGDGQARALLNAPDAETLKGKPDRAILATFLYHGLRCEELCRLKVRDVQQRGGVLHLRIHGKRGKVRFVPAHAAALEGINSYVETSGHKEDADGPLFRPVKNPISGDLEKPLSPGAVYTRIVKHHARAAGVDVPGFCVHALRATAATNALAHEADISKVQEWLGHARQPDSTTAGEPAPRTAQRSRWSTEVRMFRLGPVSPTTSASSEHLTAVATPSAFSFFSTSQHRYARCSTTICGTFCT